MYLPKFLLADSSDSEDAFVLHTQYPRFLLNINTEDVEWFDDLDEEEDLNNQIKVLMDEAFEFFDNEMEAYEDDDDEYGV